MDDAVRVIEAITASIRPSYGPFGKDRLVVTETQKLVTNSAIRILEQVRPGSPLAKLVLAHIRKSAASLGDGTSTLALLLEGVWQQCATSLRDGNAKQADLALCLTYIENYIIPQEIVPLLKDLRCSLTQPEQLVIGLAHSFFGANFPPNICQHLSKTFWAWLVANADCVQSTNSKDCRKRSWASPEAKERLAAAVHSLEHDDLIKIPVLPLAGSHASAGGGMSSSSIEHTHIITGVLGHAGMPVSVEGGRAVVLDEAVAPLPVEVSAPGAMRAHLAEMLLLAAQRLWQSGVRVALCASEVHEEWRGALAQRGILLLQLVEPAELHLLERGRASSRIRLTIDDTAVIVKNSLPLKTMRPLEQSGQQRGAASFASGRSIWALSPGAPEVVPHCWLLLRAPSVGLAVEYKYALKRLLRIVTPLLSETSGGTPIYGGLAFELAVARLAQVRLAGSFPDGADCAELAGIGVKDKTRALRLHGLSWQILASALLHVLEAFLENLVTCRPSPSMGLGARVVDRLLPTASLWPPQCVAAAANSDKPPRPAQSLSLDGHGRWHASQQKVPKAGRLARWLVVADPEQLKEEGADIGIHALPQGKHFGLNLWPGIGAACQGDLPLLLEMDVMKLGLLRAVCGLSRQIIRLDPECLRCGGPSSVRGVHSKREVRGSDEDESDRSSGSE